MIFLTMVAHLLTLKKTPYVPSDLVSIKARFSGSGKNSIFVSFTYAPVGFAWRGSFTMMQTQPHLVSFLPKVLEYILPIFSTKKGRY